MFNKLTIESMKKGIAALFLVCGGWAFGQGSMGEIIGTVLDNTDKTGLSNAKVWVEDNGAVYQARTDIDGRFRISAVPAGKYLSVSIVYFDDTLKVNQDLTVVSDGFGNLGTIYFGGAKMLDETVINPTYTLLKLAINATPCYTMGSKDISRSAVKFSIQDMLSAMTSEVKKNENGDLMFKGSRAGDMLYLVDGIKTRSIGPLPSCGINSMVVYTGGLPAKYGDTMGGVIVLETKSYFDLLKERSN